jgi:hypothetical protein
VLRLRGGEGVVVSAVCYRKKMHKAQDRNGGGVRRVDCQFIN